MIAPLPQIPSSAPPPPAADGIGGGVGSVRRVCVCGAGARVGVPDSQLVASLSENVNLNNTPRPSLCPFCIPWVLIPFLLLRNKEATGVEVQLGLR